MNQSIQNKVTRAFEEKKLNRVACNEILRWLSDGEFEEFLSQLTQKIQEESWDFLMDAFYMTLIFGTGGIRGKMDIGTNRINNHTIRLASGAFARYLLKHKKDIVSQGVAIAYDSRTNSEEFMKETARILAAYEIPVHIFDYYRATPELSFVVRFLKLAGGIVITASHNPPEFNGYKVYDERGVQVLPDAGQKIEEEFKSITSIKKNLFKEGVEKGIIKYIDKKIDEAFKEAAKKVSLLESRDAKIVFSPLHGVGSQSVLPVLQEIGFTDIHVVEEQMSMDGNFPNVAGNFPNPELKAVYELPIALAKKVGADIVLVSDPDADRLGIAVPDSGNNWTNLNGNQGAVLMGYFYLSQLRDSEKLPKNPVIIKTSVTTALLCDIAKSFGAEVIGDLLVGFKFIGDKIEHLPKEKNFLFACEESVGYLFTDAYRDKGAETPAIIAAEMAVWCKEQKIAPIDLLETIYKKYGYYAERLYYRSIEGYGAMDQMNGAMKLLRSNLPKKIGDKIIVKIMDRQGGRVYDGQTGELLEIRDWDRGDMLSFFLSEDERDVVHVRPSGTEPKMKYYTTVKGNLQEKTKEAIEREAGQLEGAINIIFEEFLDKVKVPVV